MIDDLRQIGSAERYQDKDSEEYSGRYELIHPLGQYRNGENQDK